MGKRFFIDFLSIITNLPVPVTQIETWDWPKPYLIGRITAAARICLLDEIDVAVSCYSTDDYMWGMRCGANAFTIGFNHQRETIGMLEGEVGMLKTMWCDSAELKECLFNNN